MPIAYKKNICCYEQCAMIYFLTDSYFYFKIISFLAVNYHLNT